MKMHFLSENIDVMIIHPQRKSISLQMLMEERVVDS